ncbi:MAG: arginine--tRNA ligase [Patescibacteria group bacterium]|nr:arginine--tRNA ligase [Patescibacteria group bacterium]
MYLKVDSKIFQKFPDLALGVLIVKGLDNTKKHTTITQLMNGAIAQQKSRFDKENLDDHVVIRTWRDAYKSFGSDPTKTSCSIEGLLKRVLKKKEIPKINALVDIYNYFSIKNMIPIGGEDMDRLCGDVKLTLARGDEPFRAIVSEKVESPDEGEVVYKDSGGVTCRKWNWRECDRTKFGTDTKNAVLIMEDLGILKKDKLQILLRELAALVKKYCGGETEERILTQEKSEVDLGIAGKTGVNDAEYQGTVIKKKSHTFLPQVKKKVKTKLEGSTLLRIKLESLMIDAAKKAYPQKEIHEATIEYPKDESHGDYSCNVAMGLAKELSENPHEVAREIVDKVKKPQYLDKIEVKAPGFINFYLDREWLEKEAEKAIKGGGKYGSLNIGEDRTIVIDFSQPNIAKPLGIHHLLSTVIGQSLYNIYSFLGFKCVGVNHIGDWGTQFGKLTYAYKQWGKHEVIEKDPINELLKLYVKFHDEAGHDPSIEDNARAEFKKLEDGDEQNTKLWKWFVDISLEEVQKTYDFLGGIHFDHIHGESFYNDKMDEIIEDGKNKKVIIEGDDESLIIKYENDKYPPFLVQKSDGATLYSTRDLAAVKYRQDTWSPEKILYVVDVAQSLYFQQLFEAEDLLGTREAELVHVVFGRMQFSDKKMSTRKGNIILLDEVLKEAEKKARKIVDEKNPDLSDEDKEALAHKIGVGAVKYSALSQNRTTNITFDWDKILALDGNSAPYLQYTYARAMSILKRKGEKIEAKQVEEKKKAPAVSDEKGQVTLFEAIDSATEEEAEVDEKSSTEPLNAEDKEMKVLREIVKFSEHVALSAAEYKPNILANYLYNLAQKFNTFYNSVPVLAAENSEKKEARLKLTESVTVVLENGLKLLGIEVMERM